MKHLTSRAIAVTCVLGLFASSPAPGRAREPQAPTLRIDGAVETAGEWTADKLRTAFAGDVKAVTFALKGEAGTAHCIPLLALIRSAKPRLKANIKNHQLAFVALVRAEDGYTVAYTLGEMLPKLGNRQVWIALDRDGNPFSGDDAPVQLIVPADEKGARWVHGVRRITLVDGFEMMQGDAKREAADK